MVGEDFDLLVLELVVVADAEVHHYHIELVVRHRKSYEYKLIMIFKMHLE